MRCPHCNKAIEAVSQNEIDAYRLVGIYQYSIASAASTMACSRSTLYEYLSSLQAKTGVNLHYQPPPAMISLRRHHEDKIVQKW